MMMHGDYYCEFEVKFMYFLKAIQEVNGCECEWWCGEDAARD